VPHGLAATSDLTLASRLVLHTTHHSAVIVPASAVVPVGTVGSGSGASATGGSGAFFFLTVAILAGIGLVPPLLRRRLRLADELGAPPAFVLLLERPG
jgi:hypothetical protein